jgi:hypothetical protein
MTDGPMKVVNEINISATGVNGLGVMKRPNERKTNTKNLIDTR